MLRARADGPDGPTIILGITEENVNRMKDGQPIRVTGASVGVPGIASILILYGDDHRTLMADLHEAGAIGPETKRIVDPKITDL